MTELSRPTADLGDVFDVPLPTLADDEQIYFAPHLRRGRFFNPWDDRPIAGLTDVMRWQATSSPFRRHKKTAVPWLPIEADPRATFAQHTGARLLWLGHASFLVEVQGLRVLIDPVLGRAGGLVPRLVPSPLTLADLGPVDVVLITHGHHDHLDTATVKALGLAYDPIFVVPLGLSKFLPKASRRRVELDWWQGVHIGEAEVALVPAQHWHRRGALDVNRALWGGYVLRAPDGALYHSGDTGWFDGFATIGRVFPDLDAAILPMGAYEPRWFMGPQHMPPEDSVRAFRALGAKKLIAMHWGTFDLSDEPVDHGVTTLLPELRIRQSLHDADAVVLAHGGSMSLRTGS